MRTPSVAITLVVLAIGIAMLASPNPESDAERVARCRAHALAAQAVEDATDAELKLERISQELDEVSALIDAAMDALKDAQTDAERAAAKARLIQLQNQLRQLGQPQRRLDDSFVPTPRRRGLDRPPAAA